MDDWGPETYGEKIADVYDELYEHLFDAEATADLLADLAAGGRALELAIGTGRVALPLAERGIEVQGVDISPSMVDKLREKAGGHRIEVTIGNFADVPVEGTFDVVYLVFNTLFALLEQEDQVRCFQNVARHLRPGGAFVVEAFVPDPARFDRFQRMHATDVGEDLARFDVTRVDPVHQRVYSQHVTLRPGAVELHPVALRYAWPAELDLMARLAGLRLRDRWGGWRREPFTSSSDSHVSVYELE